MEHKQTSLAEQDRLYLAHCVLLAEQALDAGDEPFGSILVDRDGQVIAEERNLVGGGDATQHPEFALARWAAHHVAPAERADCTVYTSGEHCPMCSAAHAWVGLGRIVYASSTQQLAAWMTEWQLPGPPLIALSIQEVAPSIPVAGPDPVLSEQVRELHRRYRQSQGQIASSNHG